MAETTTGILKCVNKRQYAVRFPDRSYRVGQSQVMVNADLTSRFALAEGVMVTGQIEQKKGHTRLVSIESLGGMKPETFGKRLHELLT